MARKGAKRKNAGRAGGAGGAARAGTVKAGARKAPFAIPDGWTLDRGGKSMSYRVVTEDFLEAIALINAVAPIAEELEHHPDFHLEQWNRLRITTWSHDVGGLTKRDQRLAKRISALMERRFEGRARPGGSRFR